MGNALNNVNLGRFPSEFNPKIHGAYQADRFYGTRKHLMGDKVVCDYHSRLDSSLTTFGQVLARLVTE